MSESWIIEIAGDTAGIVVREAGERWFAFHAAHSRFGRFNGLTFTNPREAERSLRAHLAQRRQGPAARS
jgi:hypothetical protein